MNAMLKQLKQNYSKKALFYKAFFLLSFIYFKKMPLVTTLKAVCYAVLITLIITTGLNIFNTLNTFQLERIQQINKALK
jgi:hypothetical protein|tara:strand:- start:766 stop:1002 length:237 start_codon:yes stop_codon:yes gene_type:complete